MAVFVDECQRMYHHYQLCTLGQYLPNIMLSKKCPHQCFIDGLLVNRYRPFRANRQHFRDVPELKKSITTQFLTVFDCFGLLIPNWRCAPYFGNVSHSFGLSRSSKSEIGILSSFLKRNNKHTCLFIVGLLWVNPKMQIAKPFTHMHTLWGGGSSEYVGTGHFEPLLSSNMTA